MRLQYTTTILWAAGTVLAGSKDQYSSPGSGDGPAYSDGNKATTPSILAGTSRSSISCKPKGISDGSSWIFRADANPQIAFDCSWASSSNFSKVLEIRLRQFASPTPTLLSSSSPTTSAGGNTPSVGAPDAGPAPVGNPSTTSIRTSPVPVTSTTSSRPTGLLVSSLDEFERRDVAGITCKAKNNESG